MKSYGVAIQMKPLLQYFYMVPFVFQYFTKMLFRIFLEFLFLALLEVKRVKRRVFVELLPGSVPKIIINVMWFN